MKISYTQALKKLEQYGQEHILRYYDELEEAGKEELVPFIRRRLEMELQEEYSQIKADESLSVQSQPRDERG